MAYSRESSVRRTARKSVTINEVIKDQHERARHVRAQRFHGKEMPDKGTRGDTVVYGEGEGPFTAPPPEINTARMMEALRSSGVGNSAAGAAAQREYEERVRRAKELRPKRPLTDAQLASEAACNAVIAEQRSIVFAKAPDLVESGIDGGSTADGNTPCHETVLSLKFDTLTIGDFVVSSSSGRQRAAVWNPPHHGSSAPPAAEATSYCNTAQGLWCSTAIERTAVLRENLSGSSGRSLQKDWSQCKSSRMAIAEAACACQYCSGKVGKQVSYVPSQESLQAAANAGAQMKRPPDYRPGARTEKEQAPHLPRVYLAQAVIDVKPDCPPHMKNHSPHRSSSSHSRSQHRSRPAPRVHGNNCQPVHERHRNQAIRPARHSKLAWIFALDWLGGNVAKVEIDLAGVCAVKLVGRTLTVSVTTPAAIRRFVGYEYKGQFSQWQLESPGVDFSAGECTNATQHILVARRKADMTAFCERLSACSAKFANLLAPNVSNSEGSPHIATKSTRANVSFILDGRDNVRADSSTAQNGSGSTSLAEMLQAGGADAIIYAAKPLVPHAAKDHDWGKKAWNERPRTTPASSNVPRARSLGLRRLSENDVRSRIGERQGRRSRSRQARPGVRKQAWSPSAIVPAGWLNESEAESRNIDLLEQDSTVSMSRSEQRVYGADASVAELLS